MIIRSTNRERWVTISKISLEDKHLSWRARGLHAFLMSKPNSWRVSVAHLTSQGPDGREAVMAALKELKDAGYLVQKKTRGGAGRFDGSETEVYEEPQVTPETGLPTTVKPDDGFADTNELLSLVSNENELQGFDSDFTACWQIWPKRQDARKPALTAYKARRREGVTAEDLLKATRNYAEAMRREKRENSKILNCETFFGPNERWMPYLEEEEAPGINYDVPTIYV